MPDATAPSAASPRRPHRAIDAWHNSDREGRWSSRVHRPRRPVWQIIKETPFDWLFERNRVPGTVLGVILTLSIAPLLTMGMPLAIILAINWGISQGPCATQFVRTVFINTHRNHIYNPLKWDWTWWTRSQAHQRSTVAEAPEPPLETIVDWREFSNPKPTWCSRHLPGLERIPGIGPLLTHRHPWFARQVLRMEQALLIRAESDTKDAKRFWAGQLDDWLNQRARTPSFIIGMGEIIVTQLAGMSLVTTLLVNAIVEWIPSALGLFLGWQTGDAYRITRPGIHQRPRIIARQASMEGRDLEGPTVAAPELGQGGSDITIEGTVLRSPQRSVRQRPSSTSLPTPRSAPGISRSHVVPARAREIRVASPTLLAQQATALSLHHTPFAGTSAPAAGPVTPSQRSL